MATTGQKGMSVNRVCGPHSANIELLECPICQDLLWKPVACQSCETPFCSACINEWLANHPKICPNQCETYAERKCPPIIVKLLAQLQITCSNQEQGCQEAIAYEALDKHEAECGYQLQRCSSCQSQILKKDFINHENECEIMEVPCVDCNLRYRKDNAATHTEIICLREQFRRFRDDSKKYKHEIQDLSRQLCEIRAVNPISTKMVINFADLPSAEEKSLNITSKYQGLKWTTVGYMHKSFATKKYSGTGYAMAFAASDSPHIAFFKDRASISAERPNETFTLLSLDACAAWKDSLQLTIKGYQKSTEIITRTTTIPFGAPQTIVLKWKNIDRFVLESSGGTAHPELSDGGHTHVVLTKLVINQFN